MNIGYLKFIKDSLFCRLMVVILCLACLPIHVCAQHDTDSSAIVDKDTGEPDVETGYDVVNEQDKSISPFSEQLTEGSASPEQRHLPEGYSEKMKKDKKFWYADADIKKKKTKILDNTDTNYIPFGQQTWVKTLLWLIIIGGFAAALMWYLAGSEVGLFRKKQITISATNETDEMPENIFAINYQKEIDKAVAQGNYRMAVRMMFLRLLKNMSDKNIISYKQDKTNLDYMFELQATDYYSDFFRLTRHYEYGWYGKFDISHEAWLVIANDFNKFDRKLINR